jgi:hypothetical protein
MPEKRFVDEAIDLLVLSSFGLLERHQIEIGWTTIGACKLWFEATALHAPVNGRVVDRGLRLRRWLCEQSARMSIKFKIPRSRIERALLQYP